MLFFKFCFLFGFLVSKLVSNFLLIKEFMEYISKESITAKSTISVLNRQFRPLLPDKFLTKSENSCGSFFRGHL